MRQLLYVSNASREVPESVLEDILMASRKNNSAVGVTGLLLFLDGGFMQVLEGEADAVSQTYARICEDARHWNTKILLDRDAPRAFGEWSMGFDRPSSTARDNGVFLLTRDAIAGKLKPGAPAEIMALLKAFYRVNAGNT